MAVNISNSRTLRPSSKDTYFIHPKKFTLWLFLASIVMMFGAFTSALIVSRGEAVSKSTWLSFSIPSYFTISCIMIIASSVAMQYSYIQARRNNLETLRTSLWITLALGLGFLVTQILGFRTLIQNEIYLSNQMQVGERLFDMTASSYFYLISLIHGLHVIGGILVLIGVLVAAYKYLIHSKAMLKINLCTTYWHFVGVLWLYLYAILSSLI